MRGGLQPIAEHAAYRMESAEPPTTIPSPFSCHSTASRVVKGEVRSGQQPAHPRALGWALRSIQQFWYTSTQIDTCYCCSLSQDVLYIHPLAIATQPPSMLYMVCDGHSGALYSCSKSGGWRSVTWLGCTRKGLPTTLAESVIPAL